ncbi:MAG: alpha-mannosidase, partial [Lentisphaeraceae bacterium]|nr:alpha-mannosidase [Lentisphaeraceae bacterium]
EAQIRQFSRGMKYLKDEFNYKPDSYWLPDTFGYNAALPQIIKGCGLKYFLTTKLSWNESNTFPYDSFIWRGIDGSEVVAHFNETHCWADPQTLLSRLNGVEEGKFVGEKFSIRHKDVTDKRLIAYGFGDGGGGPMYEMLEMARRVEDLEGIPKAKNMTVSEFMDELVDSSPKMPRYNGELYLELHRGTLTHQHKIKQGNRQMEIAVRALELLDVRQKLNGQEGIAKEDLDALWKTLLINQFHDILPGTSLPEVHDLAIEQYEAALEKATQLSRTREIYGEGTYKLVNSLNWKYTRNISVAVENEQRSAEGVVCETYTDIDDRPRLLMESGLKGLSESSITLSQNGTPLPEISSFYIQNNKVRTPFYEFNLSDEGVLENLLYLPENRTLDLVGKAFNEFIIGEDLPALWDSWDIDYDQQLKMQAVEGHVKTEIIHNGQLHLRIRSTRKIGTASSLVQDVIFYKNTPQIDFETLIDWHEKHMLLQTKFDLNVFTNSIKCEIPFGYVERQTHDNTPVDRACFEFSQHKYSDLSESRFGIAFLNNGKYAIAAEGSTVKLSLLKSGGHPDPRGDEGRHYTTYSVLPHSGPLAVNTVVQAAYELNHLPLITVVDGTLDGNSLCSFSKDNIIVESIKWAEDGNGWVMRVYEAEGSTTQCDMNFSSVNYKVLQTDMLEENGQEVLGGKGIYALNFHAFEIKTIKVCRLAQ